MMIDSPPLSTRRDPALSPPVATQAGWQDVDIRAVDTIRLLAADAVQKVGNGHPGTAMSLAPVAYLLYQQVMRHDPSDPDWLGRDRFVLSAGHSSLTQYLQLFASGYDVDLEDIKALRTLDSKTPGHPERHRTSGVEITTGPLGSGLASAVGMAMAVRRQHGLLDPDTPWGHSPFDHRIYVIASDGDLMEGVSAEASSLAGHQRLDNLMVIYDQNFISIEDDTNVTFSEDVEARYRSYGWHVERVDWRRRRCRPGDDNGHAGSEAGLPPCYEDVAEVEYVEDIDALLAAIRRGQAITDRPTLIVLNTIIAWPAPTKQNTGASHGAALGTLEIAQTKQLLGFDPKQHFQVEAHVLEHTRQVVQRGRQARAQWQEHFDRWAVANPQQAALLERLRQRQLPEGVDEALPVFEPDDKGVPTRVASGKVLGALAPLMPELWGGSADLGESNNTTIPGETSFLPADRAIARWQGAPYGRMLHFGVRENAMGMIVNGMALEGLTRPYAGTFLVFSDYLRPAIRLTALQRLGVTFVLTHDSIGVGEDGPTHQPIEHLASLRAMPDLAVVRPGDANETVAAWRAILANDTPAGLCLSRQPLPVLDRSPATGYAGTGDVAKGAYVLAAEAGGSPEVILIATGSELSLALAARTILQEEGTPTRVVSMPCWEWFAAQDEAYRHEVLPPAVKARVSVEAGSVMGWCRWVGDAGRSIGIDHFGASADPHTLFHTFGITTDAVVAAARESLQAARADGPSPAAGP